MKFRVSAKAVFDISWLDIDYDDDRESRDTPAYIEARHAFYNAPASGPCVMVTCSRAAALEFVKAAAFYAEALSWNTHHDADERRRIRRCRLAAERVKALVGKGATSSR